MNKTHLESLEEFASSSLNRFHDHQGNMIYQTPSGDTVKIIPRKYTKTNAQKKFLNREKEKLDNNLQLSRNRLALEANSNQNLKDEYNDQVSRSEKVEALLASYNSNIGSNIELRENLQKLQLENKLLLHSEIAEGKLVKSGSLYDLGKKLKELTKNLNTQIEKVFTNPIERPAFPDLKKREIPSSEEGNKLQQVYSEWLDLSKKYK